MGTSLRFLPWVICAGWLGCSSVSVDRGPEPEPGPGTEPTACDGRVGADPVRVTGGLADQRLLVHGGKAYAIDPAARSVVAIDLCDGGRDTVLSDVDVASAVLAGDALVFVRPRADDLVIARWPLGADTFEDMIPIPRGMALAAAEGRVVGKMHFEPSEDPNELEPVGFYEVDLATASLRLLYTAERWAPGTSTSLVGASSAGAYLRSSYDCGCSPSLVLAPFDGTGGRTIDDTAGALAIAALGGELFAAVDLEPQGFGEMDLDIVSLPVGGGEPDVLWPKDGVHTVDVRSVAADASHVCWGGWGLAPRCLDRATGQLRVVGTDPEFDAVDAVLRDASLHDGVLVWYQSAADETVDLYVAVP